MASKTDNTELAASQVFELGKLVDYQSGAIVSRTLIDRQAGTVTLFSFDKGQGLSEHKAPFEAMVVAVDGQALITISGREYRLVAGETIVMPADEPHSLRAIQRFKMLLIMIKA